MKKAISVILSLCLIPVMGVSAIVIASKPDEEKASDKLIEIEISNVVPDGLWDYTVDWY